MVHPPAMVEPMAASINSEPQFELRRFGVIKREHDLVWPPTSPVVSLPVGFFRDLLKRELGRIRFDEHYYLRMYADVADAVASGLFSDAHQHYVEFGYFEDRLPYQVEVDSAFYFRTYPDIREEIAAGTIRSTQEHFELYGYKEGRLPKEGWSLVAG